MDTHAAHPVTVWIARRVIGGFRAMLRTASADLARHDVETDEGRADRW